MALHQVTFKHHLLQKVSPGEQAHCPGGIEEAIVALVQLKTWIEANTNNR